MFLTKKRRRLMREAVKAHQAAKTTAVEAPVEEAPLPVSDDLGEPEGNVEMDPLPLGWEYSNKEGLQGLCKEHCLDTEGSKRELKERLQAWENKYFPSKSIAEG